MKYQFLQTRFAKLSLFCAAFGILFSAFASTTQAQATTTFAQYLSNGGGQDYTFTNNGGTSGSFNTITGGAPIFFFYQNIPGLNPALTGLQNAHITITTTTTTPSTLATGIRSQPLNQQITVTITRDTPAPVGVGTGSRTVLLSVIITPNTSTPTITGADGGNSATLSASFSPTSQDNNVLFASDFLNFSATTARNLGFSFSSVTPNLSAGLGGFLNTLTAAGTGTFASNPVPTTNVVTAASVTVGGRVLTPSGRGLRNAQVTVTQADGSTRTVLTGVNGTYSFADLTVPQTVVLSVRSKSYRFTAQVVSLDSDLAGIDFFAESNK